MCRLCASVAVTMPISRSFVLGHQLPVGRSEEETRAGRGRPVPVQGVLLLVALLPRNCFFVDGATRLSRGPNPASHPPHEPPFDLQRKGSGGGAHGARGGRVHVKLSRGDAGGTANRQGHPFLRKSSETADVRDGRTDDRTRGTTMASSWNDVRVSPIDEGVGVADVDELSRAARRRRRDGQNCGDRAPRGCPADLLLGTLGPFRARRSVTA